MVMMLPMTPPPAPDDDAAYPRWWSVCDGCQTITQWEKHPERPNNLPDPDGWENPEPVCAVCDSPLMVGDAENDTTTARENTARAKHQTLLAAVKALPVTGHGCAYLSIIPGTGEQICGQHGAMWPKGRTLCNRWEDELVLLLDAIAALPGMPDA